ncbi:MAG: ribose 5-phosphate isomerase B [Lachnospiraceae bacterium]|nr:ribose 5-phosphate isomerase B [Lachnospiraceae bacterium]MCI7596420.1 ribose 5-phosphate isomerase B [Lachnospiraceae bacterium]MDD7050935.1 ribose 5-phosphate isomerase B [Lachnospiraceae bacterium]MDY3222663.1 ribose 5-phosphate isomerase B [Lachnospiraceae bacterium]MDY4095324.1 ribose 5-phosphate isomerase B [Lachnospiraceae bacterium]
MIALGSDHGGYDLKKTVIEYLEEKNIPYEDFGCYDKTSCDYPEFGRAAARAVASGECEKGIVICTTGIGISMVANKIKGIRAALCTDPYSAKMTRLHNDANVLALGGGIIGKNMALEIVEVFLNTEFSQGENHIRRIGQLED